MTETISLTTALIIGLLGGAHCIGMCGGIVNALAFAIPQPQRNGARLGVILLAYNLGRILSYSVAGIVAGALGWIVGETMSVAIIILRVAAGLLMLAMGFYIAGWWLGLRRVERAGDVLWRRLEPLSRRLMPVYTTRQGLLLGAVWGWLPCGMVYSVWSWAATSGSALQGGLMMAFFGLGTLPAMLASGAFSGVIKIFIQKKAVRGTAGVMIIAFGVWTIAAALYPLMSSITRGNHEHSMAFHQAHPHL